MKRLKVVDSVPDFLSDLEKMLIEYHSKKAVTHDENHEYVTKFRLLRERAKTLGLNFVIEREKIQERIVPATES